MQEKPTSNYQIIEAYLFKGTKHQIDVSAFDQSKDSCTLQFDGSSIGLLERGNVNHKIHIQKRGNIAAEISIRI